MYAIEYKNIFSCAPDIKNRPKGFFLDDPITRSWGSNIEVDLFCKTIELSCNRFLLIEGSFTVHSKDEATTIFSLYINQKKVSNVITDGTLATTGIIWGNKIRTASHYDKKINIRITAVSTRSSNIDPISFKDFADVKGGFLSITTL